MFRKNFLTWVWKLAIQNYSQIIQSPMNQILVGHTNVFMSNDTGGWKFTWSLRLRNGLPIGFENMYHVSIYSSTVFHSYFHDKLPKIFNLSRTASQNFSDSSLVLQLSLPNPLSSQEWRCSWSSADRRCSNYIHLSDQRFYCLLRCYLY